MFLLYFRFDDETCKVTHFARISKYDSDKKTAKNKLNGVLKGCFVVKRSTKTKCLKKQKQYADDLGIEMEKENESQIPPKQINKKLAINGITTRHSKLRVMLKFYRTIEILASWITV